METVVNVVVIDNWKRRGYAQMVPHKTTVVFRLPSVKIRCTVASLPT